MQHQVDVWKLRVESRLKTSDPRTPSIYLRRSLGKEECDFPTQSLVEHGSRLEEKGPGGGLGGEDPSFWDKAILNCGYLPEFQAYSPRVRLFACAALGGESRFHQNSAFRFFQNKTQQAIKLPTPVEKAPRIYGP